ncbi:MAG: prepilin-type N-terminal cleavage/methylation domain-containing protein [Candidatus Zixiibacteriota bacterium]|nr:MAG: prepilin-type N-terminal cleavage/methylation domain-containing protein [candidate division Zixibacteria bacterium]
MKRVIADTDGFGLIELTVVIIVIGILVGTAMKSLDVAVAEIRRVNTEREMARLAKGIVGDPKRVTNGVRSDFGYVGDVGAFPTTLDDLVANPGGYATWHGPYVPVDFAENANDYRFDEWGKAYTYGVTTITSTGSGTSLVQQVAASTADYLLNQAAGKVTDGADASPGLLADSVDIAITVPDGVGGTITKLYHPDAVGYFLMDSLPVGRHLLQVIYAPNADTLTRYLTVLPRNRADSTRVYRFAQGYF